MKFQNVGTLILYNIDLNILISMIEIVIKPFYYYFDVALFIIVYR